MTWDTAHTANHRSQSFLINQTKQDRLWLFDKMHSSLQLPQLFQTDSLYPPDCILQTVFYSYPNIYCRKSKACNVVFFQYHAALIIGNNNMLLPVHGYFHIWIFLHRRYLQQHWAAWLTGLGSDCWSCLWKYRL